jgi:hypothetical protein
LPIEVERWESVTGWWNEAWRRGSSGPASEVFA